MLNLEGSPEAYREFIKSRNAVIARDIADYMGIPYYEHTEQKKAPAKASYLVPAITVDRKMAEQLGIESEADFYGGRVDCRSMVGKSILHESVSSQTPQFYSEEFAHNVRNLVLPGFTGFTKKDIMQGYRRLSNGDFNFRLKLPNESDGNGQYIPN